MNPGLPANQSSDTSGGDLRPGDVCPYLRLERDAYTAAAYVRLDHQCILRGNVSLSRKWQQHYCVGSSHVNCPYYRSGARSAPKRTGSLWPARPPLRTGQFVLIAVLTLVIVTAIVLITHDRFSGSVLGMAVDVSDSAEGADQTGGAEIDIPTAAPSPTMSPTPFREFVYGEFEDESAVPLLQDVSTKITDPFEPHWMRTGAILVDLETDQAWFRERKPVPPRIGAESEGLPSEGEPGSEY